MSFEPIGAIAVLIGLLMLRLGPGFGIWAIAMSCLLGAAAVVKLPMLGDASVLPAHFLSLFFVLSILLRPAMRAAALRSLQYPGPGFLFAGFVIYGVLSALFLPRIFADMTHVYSLSRMGEFVGIVATPLQPRASNITQAAYLFGNLVMFAAAAGYIASGGARNAARAFVGAGVALLCFAALDLATYHTGNGEALALIRNANYRILGDGEIGGFKRIVGSFTEAGAYAYAAIGLYAFSLQLWLTGQWPRLTGTVAILLLSTILLSTSSMAYATILTFSVITFAACLGRLAGNRATAQGAIYLFASPVILLMLVVGAMLVPQAWAAITGLFDATVVNKLASQSGVERAQWNVQAMRSFADTFYLGAGVGSVRTSSLLVAILSNTGIVGLLLFLAFLARIAFNSAPLTHSDGRIAIAGSSACIALFIAGSVSATSVDLGLPFSLFAALSAAAWQQRPAFARAPRLRAAVAGPAHGFA